MFCCLHIDDIVGRARARLNVLRVLSRAGTDGKTLINLYKIYVRPLFEYGSAAFIAAPAEQIRKIQKVQNEAIRIGLRLPSYLSIKLIHDAACLSKIEDRFKELNKSLINTMIANNEYIKDLAQNRQTETFITNTLSPIEVIMK